MVPVASRAALWGPWAFAVILAPACFANGPEIGFDAGTIFPMESRNVQLVSEEVEIRLPTYWPAVDTSDPHNAFCKYVLRNLTDSTQVFSMAFVSNENWSDEDTTQ